MLDITSDIHAHACIVSIGANVHQTMYATSTIGDYILAHCALCLLTVG